MESSTTNCLLKQYSNLLEEGIPSYRPHSFVLYTDGTCADNKRASWSYLLLEGEHCLDESSLVCLKYNAGPVASYQSTINTETLTTNEAELSAVQHGLTALKRLLQSQKATRVYLMPSVTIRTDSVALVNILKKDIFAEVSSDVVGATKSLINDLSQNSQVKFKYELITKRSGTDRWNNKVDLLARKSSKCCCSRCSGEYIMN